MAGSEARIDNERARINPDRAGKWHLRHRRFGEVSTACGGSLISLTWTMLAAEVPATARCPKCWDVRHAEQATT